MRNFEGSDQADHAADDLPRRQTIDFEKIGAQVAERKGRDHPKYWIHFVAHTVTTVEPAHTTAQMPQKIEARSLGV